MFQQPVVPVAIIGMACRLPGGIDSPEKLWQAALTGEDLITEIPPHRWDVDEFYDPERGVPDRSVSRWGGFIDDVAGFDASFFRIGEPEAAAIDPQHRMLLETAWEAVEHAGLDPHSLAGSATGVFAGLSHDDYTVITRDAGVLGHAYGYTGTPANMASGRIAYALGLRGPALTVDAACSTGLLTVHLACRSLHQGESDMALAGGCHLTLLPSVTAAASGQGMLSPTGRCRPFDVMADGFARSEGCAVVLLKRLADAQRDDDRILAVIRGSAVNQDGRSPTITTPSLVAQVDVYRAALAAAGVDPDTVGAVEAHGTGTPVGDPLEFGSLAQVYGTNGRACALGSVKGNVGHTEAAAGAVGLIKTVLSLQHGVVPRMMHFTRLPDELARMDTGLFVPQAATAWIETAHSTPRRAAVSSFGMSGTNVHAVLEQTPTEQASSGTSADSASTGALVYPLSASSADELRRTSRRLADWVEQHTADVVPSDLAYTLSRRRAHRPVRRAVVADGLTGLIAGLRGIAADDAPLPPVAGHGDGKPVWVFSGHGSQWAGMGVDLLAREPVFAATVARLEPLVAHESGFSVTQALTSPAGVVRIEQVQPVLFAMQVAFAATMQSYGIQPGAVIGHSLGEAAAAVVAGALSLEDGVRVICRRSMLCARIAGGGAMASVELPAKQVEHELREHNVVGVSIAVIASPQSTVVSGLPEAVRTLVEQWERREVMAREVKVDIAAHSAQLDAILPDMASALAELTPQTPSLPFYSATLEDPRATPSWDADYWVHNLRRPVRFADAICAALEDGFRVFGEMTAHPLLIRTIEQNARACDIRVQAVPSMRREQALPHGAREFLAQLHCAGAAVDFSVLNPIGRLVDAPLPTWTHKQLMLSGDTDGRNAQGATIGVHRLLGAHVRLREEPERHVWQGQVGIATLSWLGDHRVNNVAAYPGAAYCEMAMAAARTVFGAASEVRDLQFEQLLLLPDEHVEIAASASMEEPGAAEFVIVTDDDDDQTRRAAALLHATDEGEEPPYFDLAGLLAAHTVAIDGADVRNWFGDRKVQYGPAFTGLSAVHTTVDEDCSTLLAEVVLRGDMRSQQCDYGVHPALLDACFQSVAAFLMGRQADGGLLLPLSVRRLRRYGASRVGRYCYVRLVSADASVIETDLSLLDERGTLVLEALGLRMGTSSTDDDRHHRLLSERLLTIEWQQRELPDTPSADLGVWLVIAAPHDDFRQRSIEVALMSRGADCRILQWPVEGSDETCRQMLESTMNIGGVKGVVVLVPPPTDTSEEQGLGSHPHHVRRLVRIAQQVAEATVEAPRLFVVTRGAQAVRLEDPINLEQGGLRGLLRVIGAEHPQLHPTQIDVDVVTDPASIVADLLSGDLEDEIAWREGSRYCARIRCTPFRADERRMALVDFERDGARLEVRTPGDLESLELTAIPRRTPGPGEVEVAVSASSVNFADVLVAFGRYPSFEGQARQLGLDFAGVVTSVGDGVTDHKVGDLVGGFGAEGCWGTFVTCDARQTVALPTVLTPARAVAVATTYGTAWYGLHDLARVRAGDRVLIHSASGGVGQAAIAIARWAGAEIFATAGSPQRRARLRDMNIEYVYDSRTTDFADLIRQDTDGYGVDIVLNSLTGAAQSAGLKLLAFGGRFVEIGKLDVYGNTRLALYPFRRNLSFYCVDLALLAMSHPGRIGQLIHEVFELVASGALPVTEHIEYPLAKAASAVRAMSAAEHTGKLLLSVPRMGHSKAVLPPARARMFRSDGAYLITGGLGGIGLFLAGKMASAGCGRIVLTSRSEPGPHAREVINRMRANGADVRVECGDIADPATARHLVAVATAGGLPLRGVLHAAGVVYDATLANITDELIDRDWAGKVYGAWHVHRATLGQPLDWFCSFSSAAAILGSPGQGAYAASNSWLDAFTHWRRSQGLPATAIAWGAWADIGRGAVLAERGDTTMIMPDDGAFAFEQILGHDRPCTGYFPTSGAPWLSALASRSPIGEAFLRTDNGDLTGKTLLAELTSLPRDQWLNRLRRLVADQMSLLLRQAIDPDRPFTDHGLDSLGNLELRTHIESETGIRVSPKDLVANNTVRAVAQHLTDVLSAKNTS